MNENSRLVLAVALSVLILLGWDYIIMKPYAEELAEYQKTIEKDTPVVAQPTLTPAPTVTFEERKEVPFENKFVTGSINARGARIDSLLLKNYLIDLEDNPNPIHLFSPENDDSSYFAEFGWLSSNNNVELPNKNTLWNVKNSSPQNILLEWKNPNNVIFRINIKLDDLYGFTTTQEVINNSNQSITLQNYSLLNREQSSITPDQGMLIHEGAIGVFGDILTETSYSDMLETQQAVHSNKFSWAGFSDKYWLTALFSKNPSDIQQSSFSGYSKNGQNRYQVDTLGKTYTVVPNSSSSFETVLFAGVKDLDYIELYEKDYNLTLFDRAVDFGILYFITKPIFIFLHKIYNVVGNFGLAIILLTVCIKLLLLPLSIKGFKSMNKLKDLTPKMTKIKEQYKDDNMRMQQELMNLYKKEKVNPISGCLPMILQIPIFFALYKVLYVTIEMRHAPFYWWVQDLSAKDPTNIFTLFGLIPWDAPSFLHLGVLPILMSLTMFIQQKLNPTPTDATQAQVLKFLPLIFLFLFASFPSGLLLYWVTSNILSISQQQLVKIYIK